MNKNELLTKLGESIKMMGDVTTTIGETVQFLVDEAPVSVKEDKAPVKEAPVKEATKKAPAKEEVEGVAEDFEDYTEAELKAMRVPELKEILDEMEVEYKAKESKTNLVKLILESQEEAYEEDEAEEAEEDEELEETNEEEEEADEEFVDLDAMNVTELRKYAKEEGIEIPKGRVTKAKLIDVIEEALFDDEELEEESDDESEIERLREEYGMADYEDAELRELLDEYGISSKGKRSALEFKFAQGLMDGTIPEEDFE